MKKTLVFALLLVFAALPIFAQENEAYNWLYGEENSSFKNGISVGGFGSISLPSIIGAGIEFGFGILQKESFYMRNHIELNTAYAGRVASFYGIRERLIIGGNFDINRNIAIRAYGIFELGFLLFRISQPANRVYDSGEDTSSGTTGTLIPAVEKTAFEGPFIIEPRIGFGTEIVLNKNGAIFIEFLGGEQILTNGKSFYDGYGDQLEGIYPNMYISINVGGRWYIN